jgi:hypothetical protein
MAKEAVEPAKNISPDRRAIITIKGLSILDSSSVKWPFAQANFVVEVKN